MIPSGKHDSDVFVRSVLVEMIVLYKRRPPSTLYRPYIESLTYMLLVKEYGALLQLEVDGLVRLYYLDGKVLGAELTHDGIRQAERLMR